MSAADRYPAGWWTPDRIVIAMQSYAALYGAPPTADEWMPTKLKRMGRVDLHDRFRNDGCWPTASTVTVVMGGWNTAIEAAGFAPRKVGAPPTPVDERPTHCVNGHEFTAANTFYRKAKPGTRCCRKCNAITGNASYAKLYAGPGAKARRRSGEAKAERAKGGRPKANHPENRDAHT